MSIFSKLKRHEGKVGGGFYFISVLSLSLLAAISISFLSVLIFTSAIPQLSSLRMHLVFIFIGALFGLIIRGKLSVFIHELKHSIVSSLAGNRARGMKIEEETGHFEYAFSKQTAHLNSFISLAPYTFPLFSIVSLIGFALLYSKEPLVARALLSTGFGIDLVQNAKDIGPHQTDFSEVRGGFLIGMIYVVSFNLVVFCLLSLLIIFGKAGFLEFGAWMLATATEMFTEFRAKK